MRNQPYRPSRMLPQSTDPVVSVSLVGEAVFCARAARFAFEQQQEDTGEEDLTPRRGRSHVFYSLRDIQRKRDRVFAFAVALTIIAGLPGIGVMIFAEDFAPWIPVLGLWIFFLAPGILSSWIGLMGLTKMLHDAATATTAEPDPTLHYPQPVYWWSLLQSGFQRTRPQENLFDRDWKLAGKPWCILQKGTLHIPVFRKRNEDERLYRQHLARIAAYAHLIERTENAHVPYGIVMRGRSWNGIAVPVTPPNRKAFHDALIEARHIAISGPSQAGPDNKAKCRGCPWGKPLTTDRGLTYDSPCGERYSWTPPHEKWTYLHSRSWRDD